MAESTVTTPEAEPASGASEIFAKLWEDFTAGYKNSVTEAQDLDQKKANEIKDLEEQLERKNMEIEKLKTELSNEKNEVAKLKEDNKNKQKVIAKLQKEKVDRTNLEAKESEIINQAFRMLQGSSYITPAGNEEVSPKRRKTDLMLPGSSPSQAADHQPLQFDHPNQQPSLHDNPVNNGSDEGEDEEVEISGERSVQETFAEKVSWVRSRYSSDVILSEFYSNSAYDKTNWLWKEEGIKNAPQKVDKAPRANRLYREMTGKQWEAETDRQKWSRISSALRKEQNAQQQKGLITINQEKSDRDSKKRRHHSPSLSL